MADVTEPRAAERVLTESRRSRHGRRAIVRRTAEDRTPTRTRRFAALNLTATFRFCGAAIPVMRERGGGAGSGWGLVAGPEDVAYAATKAAVVNLTRALAIDHRRIRANCVCPGDTDTHSSATSWPSSARTRPPGSRSRAPWR